MPHAFRVSQGFWAAMGCAFASLLAGLVGLGLSDWPGVSSLGLQTGIWLLALYLFWGACRFANLSRCATEAWVEVGLEQYWRLHKPTPHLRFSQLRADPAAYALWLGSVPSPDRRRIKQQAYTQPMAWSDGVVLFSEAFASLQKKYPQRALAIRRHEHYGRHGLGVWMLLPGLQVLAEWLAVRGFKRWPEPLRVIPQLQQYVWGARPEESSILRFLGKTQWPELVVGRIAELWLGAHPKNPGVIRWGNLRVGADVLQRRATEKLLGHADAAFRLLFKILDPKEPLSFQMHDREQPHAKSECWMVLLDEAELAEVADGKVLAEIYLGLRPWDELSGPAIAEFQRRCRNLKTQQERRACFRNYYGQVLEHSRLDASGLELKAFHNWIQVRWEHGRCELYFNEKKQPPRVRQQLGLDQGRLLLNIPGATVHTLQGGTVFEVQEAVDKTLRLYDYGRNDPDRPLQIQEAVDKMDAEPRPPLDYCLEPIAWDDWRTNLICDVAYAVDWVSLPAKEAGPFSEAPGFHMLVVIQGQGELCTIRSGRKKRLPLRRGEMLMIPALLPGYTMETQTGLRWLKIYEPTPEQLERAQRRRGKKFWEDPASGELA